MSEVLLSNSQRTSHVCACHLGGERRKAEVAPQRVKPEVKEDDLRVRVEFVQLLQVRQFLAREHQRDINVGPFYRLRGRDVPRLRCGCDGDGGRGEGEAKSNLATECVGKTEKHLLLIGSNGRAPRLRTQISQQKTNAFVTNENVHPRIIGTTQKLNPSADFVIVDGRAREKG